MRDEFGERLTQVNESIELRTIAYELADGRTVEYDFGLVEIEFMGELTSCRVIFGPDEAEPSLGVTALESVDISVDPTTSTLKRMPAIPLK